MSNTGYMLCSSKNVANDATERFINQKMSRAFVEASWRTDELVGFVVWSGVSAATILWLLALVLHLVQYLVGGVLYAARV